MNTDKDTPGLLAFQLRAAGLPEPEREWRFYPPRRWRFDLAYPARKLAIEVDGNIWHKSRHGYGTGMENDMRKLNTAQLLGWVVLRYSTGMVESGEALGDLERILLHEYDPLTKPTP